MNRRTERQVLASGLTPELIAAREREGWRAVAVEWEQDRPEDALSEPPAGRVPMPYGLRVSADCQHLEPEPREQETMKTALAYIAADESLSTIAERLNERGFRTREGARWTQVTLFRLLPRLIDTAPDVFRSEQWSELRLSVR